MLERPRRRDLDGILVALLYGGPIDVAHEGSDVGAGVRAEFQVEGVLVHIEGQYREAASDALTVFRSDLIDEPSVARNVGQQHPARAAGQCGRNADELLAPAIDRSKILCDGACEVVRHDASVAAEAGKIQFVQKRRVERDNLVPFQPGEGRVGSVTELEALDLLGDGIQAIEGTAVVVFVVAFDEACGDPVQRPGAAMKRCELVAHRNSPLVVWFSS
ncbi:hypothetical protein ACVWWG_005262 [Bradyrhizobium sp. LB7.2]